MTPYKAYKYCPRCSGNLKHSTHNLMLCQTCGYHWYINAAPTVGIIIEDNDGRALLGRRAIEPGKGTWDIIGGFMEPGETAYLNAIREAKEELGVTIRPGLMVNTVVAEYPFQGIDLPTFIIIMAAKIIEGNPQPADDVDELKYFSEEELDHIEISHPSVKAAYVEYFKLRRRFPLKVVLNE